MEQENWDKSEFFAFISLKREHIYLNPADDGLELYRGIKVYIDYYNNKRAHQGIGRIRPCEAYNKAA